MRNFIKKIIPMVAVVAIIAAALSTRAQEAPNCPDLVIKALETTSTQCLDIGRNEACYGNISIEASARDDVPVDQFVFNAPGDRVKLDLIKSMRLGELNLETQEWGVGYMRIRANLPDVAAGQFVTMILFGDTVIRDASVELSEKTGDEYTPMQAFYFRTGIGGEADRPLCNEFPTSGILIQTPKGGERVELMVNEVRLSVGSTILLEAPGQTETLGELESVDKNTPKDSPPSAMLVTTFEGEVEIEVDGKTITVGTGEQGSIPLDENSRPTGELEKNDTPTEGSYGALINLVNEAADEELITFVGEIPTLEPTEEALAATTTPIVAGIPAGAITLGGTGQSVPVGAAFGAPLQVKVVDALGNPVGGISVQFSAPASGATLNFGTLAMLPLSYGSLTIGGGTGMLAPGGTSATVVTNPNGVATSPSFSANTVAGTYTVTARELSRGVTTTFSLTNLAGSPANIAAVGGNNQSTPVNTAFPSPLTARVTDGYGNGVPGVNVDFFIYGQGAGASFSATGQSQTVTTDGNGNATSSTVIANESMGSFSVYAYTEGEMGTSFNLTNTAPPAPTSTFTPTLTITPSNTPAPTNTFTPTFTFTPIPPLPSVSGISPSTVPAGSAGFTLSVYGGSFQPNSVVRVNGSGRGTNYVSSGELTASISSSDVAVSGNVSITVFTPGAGSSNSATLSVTGVATGEIAPMIASLSPNPVYAGGGSFTLTVNGANFTPSSTVSVNGSGRGTTYVSPSQLLVTVLDTDIASPGDVWIQVTSENGISSPALLTVEGGS